MTDQDKQFKFQNVRIGRFDQVKLLTTKNIKYLSAIPGSEIDPSVIWSVSSIIGENELLCVHNSIIIRVPASDVLKLADYSVDYITRQFGRLSYGEVEERKERKENIQEP